MGIDQEHRNPNIEDRYHDVAPQLDHLRDIVLYSIVDIFVR